MGVVCCCVGNRFHRLYVVPKAGDVEKTEEEEEDTKTVEKKKKKNKNKKYIDYG